MAKILPWFVTLVVGVVYISGAEAAPSGVCHNSYDCAQGACCRDSSGHVLSFQHMAFMQPQADSGTCSTTKAKLGELCDMNCECDVGLECYRPVSGICCPPTKCYNATWVQQQREYWAKCATDPDCGPAA